jgi:hypothetical protein
VLLNCIKRQIQPNEYYSNILKIYVYDNCSIEETSAVVANCGFDINYKINNENIGADNNIYQCYTSVKGKYVWVIGDDELIPLNAIDYILKIIDSEKPSLIINTTNGYNYHWKLPMSFPDYASFIYFAQIYDPYFLIAHSLISENIVLKECFDAELATRQVDTHYGHFYGISSGLKKFPGKIMLPKAKTLIVRKSRASAVDGIWPETIRSDQAEYLKWLAQEYNLENFKPTEVIFPSRRERILTKIHSKCSHYRQVSENISGLYSKVFK